MDEKAKAEFERFTLWMARHAGLWSHLHVSGVAIRLGESWLNACSAIVLAESAECTLPGSSEVFRTDEVIVYSMAMPIDALPSLVADIAEGILPAERLRAVDVPIFFQSPLGEPYRWGNGHVDGPVGSPSRPSDLWTRYILEADGRQLLPDPIPYDRWRAIQERFAASRHGHLGTLAYKLGIHSHRGFDPSSFSPYMRLCAPIYARILKAGQDTTRSSAVVQVECGSLIDRSKLRVSLAHENAYDLAAEAALPTGDSITSVVFTAPPTGNASVRLVLDPDEVIDAEEIRLYPPYKADPLFVAATTMEKGLLRGGLTDGNSKHYERSIAQILTHIGFRTLWWGPNNVGKKGTFTTPTENADQLAISDDWRVVLLTESTTANCGPDKVSKLLGRAGNLKRQLRDNVGENPPAIGMILAINVPLEDVPTFIKETAQSENVAIISQEVALDFVEALEKGAPRDELVEQLWNLFPNGKPISQEEAWGKLL